MAVTNPRLSAQAATARVFFWPISVASESTEVLSVEGVMTSTSCNTSPTFAASA